MNDARPDRCGTCKFWDQPSSECRIGSPTVTFGSSAGIWPKTKPEAWCGNWSKIEINYEAMS